MNSRLAMVLEALEAGTPPTPDSGFLGADLAPEDASLVLLQAPWEVTTSYGGGTSLAPPAILRASHQMDLEDSAFDRPYRAGIAVRPADERITDLNRRMRPEAEEVIGAMEHGVEPSPQALLDINRAGESLNGWVREQALADLAGGRHVGLIGGDHASPQGLIGALAETLEGGFGILHFDAHHDLRAAYEGFTYSHASIMYNLLESFPQIETMVQVGIRDYSREEADYARRNAGRLRTFYAADLFRRQAEGVPFAKTVDEILDNLPDQVYLSFDIDALDPTYCPNTGTPVPGGLSFAEACYILERLAKSGRRVIGFDLCEVAPGKTEWDANVGARVLYKLCGCLLHSQGLC